MFSFESPHQGVSKENTQHTIINRKQNIILNYPKYNRGWSGGAMVLGKLPVPGRPTIFITVEQGPTALAVDAVGVVWTFLLSSILSFLFLPLFGRRPDID